MRYRGFVPSSFVVALLVAFAPTGARVVGQQEPIPRLETDGPTSAVQALVFSPDGKTLYEAGFDKVVRAWSAEAVSGKFVRGAGTFRVPIGPGFDGAINALALSPDGNWLAAGGLGAVRGRAGFHQLGVIASSRSMSEPMREDEGVICLFHTQRPEQRRLRGHKGAVVALAFAPARAGKPTLLVSAALERQTDGAEAAVLRLWDCEKQEQLAQTLFRPRVRGRQELAVWHTGPDPRQVSAAVVWGDDMFRVWEATLAKPWQAPSAFAYAVTHFPGMDWLAVATHGATRGQLEFWVTAPGTAPQRYRQSLLLPEGHFPLTLQPVAAPPANRWGRAAVVARVRAQDDPCVAHVIDLSPDSSRAIETTIPLWKGANRLPALAVVPGQQRAAIAGAPDQAIRILPLVPERPGAPPAVQVLSSPGRHVSQVAFASKGDARGLVLRADPRPKPGQLPPALTARDLVFDISRRAFVDDRAAWKMETLPTVGWRVDVQTQPVAGQRLLTWTARVAQGRGVRLEEVRAVTDYALRPPDGLVKVPLLAIAQLDKDGQPLLRLYHAETGEEVRQLTGHLGAVRSLAFSSDGRFLVSTGDDLTVCVWSLTNLPNHLGRHGALPGVIPREEGGKLLLAEVAAPYAAEGKLKAGQAVDGFVENDKLVRVATSSQFFDYLLLRRPGEMVTLRLGGGAGDVQVRVGQAVDEWKPLFTLFVSNTGQPGQPEWIAWNPTGPYDVSDREAERFLGWHFNPAKPDAPVAFAAAAQYREQRHRQGILKHLLAEGSLSGALAAWEKEDRARKLPKANLRLWLNDAIGLNPQRADGQGRFLIQQPPTSLNLIVDDLPADRIGTVSWQVDGLTPSPTAFTEVGRRTLTADVSALKWARGAHRVRVVVRTNDDEPHEIARELLVRYQPAPPTITTKLAAPHLHVTKPEFRLQAQVAPGMDGQRLLIRLKHQHLGKDVVTREWPSEKPFAVEETLTLREGENLIEVVASNHDAPAADLEVESARLALVVRYTKPVPDPTPVLTLEAVQVEGIRLPLEAGRPVTVNSPHVRLLGSLTSAKNLAEVELTLGDGKPRPLTKFAPDQHMKWMIQEDLRLSPGNQKVTLTARTATSERVRVVADLTYRPRLPEVVVDAPERLEFYAGYDPFEVVLSGRFTPSADPQPFTAILLVNEQERAKIEGTDAWTTKLTLAPGTNRVQVRLRNAWGAEATTEALSLRALRPPRVLYVEGETTSAKPLSGKLSAHVRSALKLDEKSISVEINGQTANVSATVVKKESDTWDIHFQEVPLREGANTVRLWVSNADARSREPAVWTIRHTPPPKPVPPPQIVLLEPTSDVNWTARDLPLRFRVRSTAALRSVVLTREGRPPLRQVFDASKLPAGNELHLRVQLTPTREAGSMAPLDLTRTPANAAGLRELTIPWGLLPGLNRFQLEATNEGGTQRVEWVVNYLYQPVRWTLTRLVPRGKGQPLPLPDDPATALQAPDARASLEGVLTWDEERPDLFAPDSEVRVRVNGLMLSSVPLAAAHAKDRRLAFAVPLVLPRAKENHIEVELAGVKVDGSRRRTLRVDCANPEKQPQRMHVLILRHGALPAAQLRQRVTDALQPDPGCELVIHGPFTGTIRPGQIHNELLLIKMQIDLRVKQGLINNVLVVYYEGAESISSLGHFFPASVKPTEQELLRNTLTCQSVADYLAMMAGAQVLLLDVDRAADRPPLPGEDRVVHWPGEVRPGVLRYSLTAATKEDRNFLMRDLAGVKPARADLQGVVEGMAANFRDRQAENAADVPPGWLGGKARGYARADGLPLLYDWYFPASYATLRVGREP